MSTVTKKRFYSPPFSGLAAVSVRRLAWSMGKPMPAAVDLMVRLLPSMLDPAKVCLACKDKSKCQGCIFCRQITEQEKAALLAF
jgi:hypothetical protein